MPADPQQLTPWFEPRDTPVRRGWYQRDYGGDGELTEVPDYWDGYQWRVGCGEDTKVKSKLPRAMIQNRRWRGLTKEQK